MSTLIERLHEVMQAEGWDHAKLMEVSGQSSSVVSQWLGKGSKVIKTIGKLEAAQGIQSASRFAALWVAKGTGPKFKAAQVQTLVAHPLSHSIPIVTPTEINREKLMRDGVPTQAFALELWDDAMAPVGRAGQVGCFVPGARAQAGDGVLLRSPDGAVHLRIYEPGIGGAWRGVSQALGHGPLGSADGCEVLAVLAWATRRDLFGAMG